MTNTDTLHGGDGGFREIANNLNNRRVHMLTAAELNQDLRQAMALYHSRLQQAPSANDNKIADDQLVDALNTGDISAEHRTELVAVLNDIVLYCAYQDKSYFLTDIDGPWLRTLRPLWQQHASHIRLHTLTSGQLNKEPVERCLSYARMLTTDPKLDLYHTAEKGKSTPLATLADLLDDVCRSNPTELELADRQSLEVTALLKLAMNQLNRNSA